MSIVNKILEEAKKKHKGYVIGVLPIATEQENDHDEDDEASEDDEAGEELEEVSTPTVTTIEPLTYDYYSPKEKEMKKKKSEREKKYREEGRYDGLY